jgi:hypothetical protein
MSQIKVGSFVASRTEPGLGPGKVFCAGHQYVLVGFVDGSGNRILRRPQVGFVQPVQAPADQSPFDGWSVEADDECKPGRREPPGTKKKRQKGAKPPVIAEWTLEQALERFLAHYPGGFQSQKFERSERTWKWSQHELWHELLPGSRLRELAHSDPLLAGAHVMKVVQTKVVPLLARKGEIPALNWALREGAPAPFLLALADVLDHPEPTREGFEALASALESLPTRDPGTRLLRWPILTVVPFLVHPEHHMFVKPKPTKEAARRLGVELLYDARPSWEVYERMLNWSSDLLEFLRPHGAKDMLDVQSFIFTIGARLP